MNIRHIAPLRPHKHVEEILVTGILNGTYPIGSAFPNERSLSDQLGVTRPTLRENLQSLAKEGWVTIQHGKSTMVNDYWEKGGLSLLSTLAKYGHDLPDGFISNLLEIRLVLLPPAARLAAIRKPETLIEYLGKIDFLPEETHAYTEFDWSLQTLFARHSGNPVYLLMLNDFASVFNIIALHYFTFDKSRKGSLDYYRKLASAISSGGDDIEQIVKNAITESMKIWETIKRSNPQDESDSLSMSKAVAHEQ